MTTWYASKTLWANVIAALAVFASTQFGYVVTEQEIALTFLAINAVMRSITGSELET